MPKIGEDMLGEMAALGLEELRAANAGQMAMDAPPMQLETAPHDARPSYDQMLEQAAASAPSQDAPDMGLSR